MSMERWSPFQEMDDMQRMMNRYFGDYGRGMTSGRENTGSNSPAIDLIETEQGYELRATLPGVNAEDIDVSINRDMLTLRAEMKEQTREEKRGNYIHRESRSGSFYRQFRLPDMVDSDNVEAELEHGVLKITLPRMMQSENKRVQIRPASGKTNLQSEDFATQSTPTGGMSNQTNMGGMQNTPGMSGMQNATANRQTQSGMSGMQTQSAMTGMSGTQAKSGLDNMHPGGTLAGEPTGSEKSDATLPEVAGGMQIDTDNLDEIAADNPVDSGTRNNQPRQ